MSQVTIRFVKTALELQHRKPGGVSVGAALSKAEENLKGLGEASLVLIDEGLEAIQVLNADPDVRPDTDELLRAHAIANQLLGYCSTVDLPGLSLVLYRLCKLVDSVLESDLWAAGTFGPVLNVLRLVRSRAVSAQDLETLMAGIDQCIGMFRAAPRERPAETMGAQ